MTTSSTSNPSAGEGAGAGKLTDESFWDDFWRTVEIPARPNPAQAFDRCFAELLERHLRPDPEATLVEVGCAPGRWLVHCHERFGYQVSGYESSEGGLAKTRENLDATGVSASVYAGDFLAADLPGERFDVVLSLGFIEHFEDPLAVLERHARILKRGGLLFLEVPNLRGLNLKLLHWTDSPLLDVHNLAMMDPKVMIAKAADVGLNPLEVKYIGGFEPQFIDASRSSKLFRVALGVASRTRRWRRLDDINAGWLSGYLCGVFRKR